MSTRPQRSTAQPLVFANLSRSKRGRALLLASLCAALLWTQASCRDLEADRGYCLVCAGTEANVGATIGTAGDGSGGTTQIAAISGGGVGGTTTGASTNATSGVSTSSGAAGDKGTSMTSVQPPAANGGSIAHAGTGAGGMSVATGAAGTTASSSGGRGGAPMNASGSNSEPPLAGAASSEPCGGCSGDTPVCDPQSGGCVQCTPTDTHACPSNQRACTLLDHKCVACVDDSTCPSDKPLCDIGKNECHVCDGDRVGACGGKTPVCDVANQRCVECSASDSTMCGTRVCDISQQKCVECLTSDECSTPDKPRCDQNACTGCAADGDCARQQGLPVCDPASRRCMQCTADRGCSGGLVCDQATHMCKDTGTHELALCKACTNDGSCPLGAACVPYNDAKGRPAGTVCLAPKSANLDCDSPPYTHQITVTSVGGTHGDFCAPPASCGTVDAFLTQMTCMAGAEGCGDAMQRDGTCSKTGTCTYHCTRTNDCPSGATCTQDGECQPHM